MDIDILISPPGRKGRTAPTPPWESSSPCPLPTDSTSNTLAYPRLGPWICLPGECCLSHWTA